MNIDACKILLLISIILLIIFIILYLRKKPQIEFFNKNRDIDLPVNKFLKEKKKKIKPEKNKTKKNKKNKKYRDTPVPPRYDGEPMAIEDLTEYATCGECPPCDRRNNRSETETESDTE